MTSLHVEAVYEPNQISESCAICGRTTSGRFSPPVRYLLHDGEAEVGDVCERCAYGSVDLWRVALIEYAIRLETQAAVLRDRAARVQTAVPVEEGVAQQLIRENTRPGPRRPGNLPPWLGGNGR